MHQVELFMPLHYVLYAIYEVTGHLPEGSFVQNVVVQIPKFDAKPNPNPNPMPIRFGKMTFRTSELLPIYDALLSFCRQR